MKIRITLHSTHPHFGGHEITTWDYEMSAGAIAAAHYRKLVTEAGQSIGVYSTVEISIVHLGREAP